MASDVMRELVAAQLLAEYQERERWLRLYVRPRPRWMPERLWRRLLARMLVLVEDEGGDS